MQYRAGVTGRALFVKCQCYVQYFSISLVAPVDVNQVVGQFILLLLT